MPYCNLYDEGWKRLGCIGCPMSDKGRSREFYRWPIYEKLWKQACRRLWENRTAKGAESVKRWPTWEAMWRWWMEEEGDAECQGVLDFHS